MGQFSCCQDHLGARKPSRQATPGAPAIALAASGR
jgi:hypothetical protein